MNFRNYIRFSSNAVQRIRVFFAQDSLKSQNKNYEWLVFEQGNDPIIPQWLSCIIIQKLIILLKVNIEVKCVYNLKDLKHLNANSMVITAETTSKGIFKSYIWSSRQIKGTWKISPYTAATVKILQN